MIPFFKAIIIAFVCGLPVASAHPEMWKFDIWSHSNPVFFV